ncbi:efflux transporter outer membrane subunit [Desulfohalovibrio reitneri]|uniref:efflux transporter outer membrane subunit n=1 Tax=Desulfohalovibrio reitneri TaxID=1307759 RepID=UPI0006925BDC|nr:efflux transporter outer membrane subunit [Desulfohalovibrio reitneri]
MALRTALAVALLLLALAAGCARPAPDLSTPVEPPPAFSRSGEAPLEERWWTAFGDQRLNELVEAALRDNFDLETAWQRLREARAVAERAESGLSPSLDATARGEASGYESNGDSGGNGDSDGGPVSESDEELRLGLAAEYEVDLWGRIRQAAEAEEFRARASMEDYRAAALSLSAEVVRTWYRLMAAHSRLDLLRQQAGADEKVLELVRARFGTGQMRSVDVLRQRGLLESTRQRVHEARSSVRVQEHQLAVLLGRPPREVPEYTPRGLPNPPPLPDAGLPAELIRRRPDIRRAFNRLRAADKDLAAAVSAQYPRLSLTGSLSTAQNDADQLFRNWAYSLAGELAAPLLDGGRREAEVDSAEARAKQRLAEYGQAILTSFREVEDALTQELHQGRALESLDRQVELASRASERLRLEYLNGLRGYIDVLTSVTEEHQLRRDRIAARLALVEYRIALYRTLAGGFATGRETES